MTPVTVFEFLSAVLRIETAEFADRVKKVNLACPVKDWRERGEKGWLDYQRRRAAAHADQVMLAQPKIPRCTQGYDVGCVWKETGA